MLAEGTFTVDLQPQADDGFAAGRMLISKTYHGEMDGTGVGQMISKRTEGGPAVYFAIEEFTGSVAGKSGSLTLLHSGRMSPAAQSLDITILEGSGSGELKGISGAMQIQQGSNGHTYALTFEL